MQSRQQPERGFNLIELITVCAVMLVVSALAAPRVLTTVNTFRLRSAANGVASLLQATRMAAVKNNDYYWAGWSTVGSGSSTYRIVYEDANRDGQYQAGEPIVQLPSNTQFDSSGSNPAFSTSALVGLSSSPQSATTAPTFNARGLPCVVSGSVCNTTTGSPPQLVYFLYFLRLNGSSGTRWAAVSVTPAGRARVWIWDGNNWE